MLSQTDFLRAVEAAIESIIKDAEIHSAFPLRIEVLTVHMVRRATFDMASAATGKEFLSDNSVQVAAVSGAHFLKIYPNPSARLDILTWLKNINACMPRDVLEEGIPVVRKMTRRNRSFSSQHAF